MRRIKSLRNDDHVLSSLYGGLPLNGKDNDHKYKKQWFGKLFKNKSLFVFDFFLEMNWNELPSDRLYWFIFF